MKRNLLFIPMIALFTAFMFIACNKDDDNNNNNNGPEPDWKFKLVAGLEFEYEFLRIKNVGDVAEIVSNYTFKIIGPGVEVSHRLFGEANWTTDTYNNKNNIQDNFTAALAGSGLVGELLSNSMWVYDYAGKNLNVGQVFHEDANFIVSVIGQSAFAGFPGYIVQYYKLNGTETKSTCVSKLIDIPLMATFEEIQGYNRHILELKSYSE